ncbi:EF-P beta-lysylation protein EpmB [Endozoicomonas elysicola]|uniref:L-lysine 2,3-aminomutase n=1 Tax=Endozoicomonas elysicola TaxID=305900 RepID=A0A081K5G1_9GAMM|nr:EF-P beta-lysylation protein EpmB [Endozoicomonas elysicola]KEI69387.1 lysine 2,3-aminomutase [Endozoicomonas elysicola]
MITRSELSVQTINDFGCWQEQLAGAVTSPELLLSMLQLSTKLLPPALKACQEFPLRVPHAYINRMELGNPNDPLLRQVLPIGEECEHIEGFGLDPLAEQSQNPTDGVIHKYHGRLLLIVGGSCAVNCRFCFRRHFPYQDNRLDRDSWNSAMEYIRSDTSIKEVILSGGDPLASNDRRLEKIVTELNHISHVETLRIHTRLPVVIPDRVTDDLINWFAKKRLQPVMVIHANHANEIDESVREATFRLKQAGVTLLNQAVLLKGINDSPSALIQLGDALFKAGVLPYYLHLLDPVHGAAHFDVPEAKAKSLIKEVMDSSPGYLVPKLVREIPGRPGKTWIS